MFLTATLLALVATTLTVQAQTFTVLHSFASGPHDGQDPIYGSPIFDSQGNMYGTTSLGGSGPCSGGCGVLFKLTPADKFTVLYSFGANTTDGKYPYGTLIRDDVGNFYGITDGGGTSGAACEQYGCGTVYKVTASGEETVLYNFRGGLDGASPYGGLYRDLAGNLYGMTSLGGDTNWGVVFKVMPSGRETVLHNFDGNTGDGGDAVGGLVADSSGNLYGTTLGGGLSGCNPGLNVGCGTIFQITEAGTESILHEFNYGGIGGEWPGDEHLLRDAGGNLYGTTQGGLSLAGSGYIFKLDSAGSFSVLHAFVGGALGSNPWSGVVADSTGNLYGTTQNGGGPACFDGCGIAFELHSDGLFEVLHEFTGGSDGGKPWGLTLDDAGNLYGMTLMAGAGDGTIYKITP